MGGELILVRHGEAHCNVAGLAGGEKTCTGLTPRGRSQVRALAERLRTEHRAGLAIEVMVSSPRLRARETAAILASALDLPLREEAALNGPAHGEADGQPWEDVLAAFGGPPQSDPDRPLAAGAETWNEYLARAGSALKRILGEHAGRRILVTGHAETISAAFTVLLGLAPGTSVRAGYAPDHASLTRWEQVLTWPPHAPWILRAFNDTSHLLRSGWRTMADAGPGS